MSRCATSLDEFTVGQRVEVVVGRGCVKPGLVIAITNNHIEVRFGDGQAGLHRPYEVMPGPRPTGQLEMFDPTQGVIS